MPMCRAAPCRSAAIDNTAPKCWSNHWGNSQASRLIVKPSSGPRYVVGCRSKLDKEKLAARTIVVLNMTTLTFMRALPREIVNVPKKGARKHPRGDNIQVRTDPTNKKINLDNFMYGKLSQLTEDDMTKQGDYVYRL